ncbi:hypothetical protein HQ529_04455 [Candidatus Woesearchaeota archaeon]|nr:hypothetical protein [Candidatus Woesearchaeota archaeon]
MGFAKWTDNILKKIKWYDIKLAQIAAMFAVLTLITLWPAFLELVLKVEWYWYLLAALVFGVRWVKIMFFD